MEIIVPFVTIFVLTDVTHTCTTGIAFVFNEEKFPNRGLYCATHRGRLSNIPLHHCKSNCLLSPKCAAVNYNVTIYNTIWRHMHWNIDSLYAIIDSTMIYMMLNERVHEHCFIWIKGSELTASHTRQVYNRNGNKRVSRILCKSGYYPASSDGRMCYTGNGIALISSNNNVCEVLVLSPCCTAACRLCYDASRIVFNCT